MKYLKLYKMFESLSDRLKNFFEDKIDWKLIKFMEECMTEYEDIGYIFYIIAYSDIPNDDSIPRIWSSKTGYPDQTHHLLDPGDLFYYYRKNNALFYGFSISTPTVVIDQQLPDNPDYYGNLEEIANKVINRVKTKFNVELVPNDICDYLLTIK